MSLVMDLKRGSWKIPSCKLETELLEIILASCGVGAGRY